MKNAINWFEIPVSDFDRAHKFYCEIFGADLHKGDKGPLKMGFLPHQGEGVSGAIVHGEGYSPSDKGSLIYLNGGSDLDNMLSKVEPAGGKILSPKKMVSKDIGFVAEFKDTEGNRIALHSRK